MLEIGYEVLDERTSKKIFDHVLKVEQENIDLQEKLQLAEEALSKIAARNCYVILDMAPHVVIAREYFKKAEEMGK